MFQLITLNYLFFPILYPLVCAAIFKISGRNLLNVLISPVFYLTCFWAVLVGIGFSRMRRWAWYVFLFANVLITYENLNLLVSYGETREKVLWFLMSLGFLIYFTVRVAQELRVPYFMPRIRWWERNTAFQISLPVVVITSSNRTRYEGNILDFSLAGCFVKLKEPVPLDERVAVYFQVFGQLIDCRGIVVWRTESSVTLPKGIGIKFFRIGRQKKKRVRMAARRLGSVLKIYRSRSSEVNEEVFQQIIDDLQTRKVEGIRTDITQEIVRPRSSFRSALTRSKKTGA